MREGVRLLRQLRHLRATSRPPPLYLSLEEPPLQPTTHREIQHGAEESSEHPPACTMPSGERGEEFETGIRPFPFVPRPCMIRNLELSVVFGENHSAR